VLSRYSRSKKERKGMKSKEKGGRRENIYNNKDWEEK
jgi:hypothetical protein